MKTTTIQARATQLANQLLAQGCLTYGAVEVLLVDIELGRCKPKHRRVDFAALEIVLDTLEVV